MDKKNKWIKKWRRSKNDKWHCQFARNRDIDMAEVKMAEEDYKKPSAIKGIISFVIDKLELCEKQKK